MILGKRVIILALLVLVVLLPGFFSSEIPGRDSGVFLYVGDQILEGKIPYRDVWDHKGPLLYYLNALGLWLGGGTVTGVQFLEFFWLFATVSIGFKLLLEAFSIVPAVLSTIIWLFNAYLLQLGNNLTEEYTLLFQFSALYLFWHSLKSRKPSWYYFVIGLTFGAAFLLRPNNIGTHISIIIYLTLSGVTSKNWGKLLGNYTNVLAGFFVVAGITIFYFNNHQAFGDLVDQVFVYNLNYASASFESRLVSTFAVLVTFISFGLAIIVLAAWIIGWLQVIGKKMMREPWGPIVMVALVGLPIETFLAGFSGWIYAHYAMALLPVIAILTAFFLHDLSSILQLRFPVLESGILLVVLSWTLNKPILQMVSDLGDRQRTDAKSLLTDIQTAVYPYESLLMWGAEPAYNFLVEKDAPTRYVYQYPLYSVDYATPEMVEELLVGIVQERPLIIDSSATNPKVPPLDPRKRADWLMDLNQERSAIDKEVDHLQDVFDYIQTNYRMAGVIGEEWFVYTYAND